MATSSRQGYKTCLLTGGTGVIGGRLLLELLASTRAKVYCMTRDEDLQDANQRIQNILAVYDPDGTYQDQYHRAVAVYGTIDEDRFDMEAEDYANLVSEVQAVFHCAAKLSLIASYEKLAPTNVEGTLRIADFCLAAKAPLLFTSSFSVIGDRLYEEGFVLQEDQFDYEQDFEDLGYEQTKFEAEKQLNALREKGLECVIVRPGNVWGDSETGCYPLGDTTVTGIYYEIVRALVETGYTIYSTEDFDVTPVDYVAKACVHLLFHAQQYAGKTFNLVNPVVVNYNDIVCFIREAGYQIRLIPDEDYFEALDEERMVRNGKPYESLFTDILLIFADEDEEGELVECALYDTSQARAALVPAGIECPVADTTLFAKYIHYCVQAGLIPPPEKQNPAEITQEMSKIHMEHLYDEDL